jgi:hypothetical protein
MWGKWAQNQNKTQTTIYESTKEFYELLTISGTEGCNLIFPNEDVARVSWKYSEDNVAAEKCYCTSCRLRYYPSSAQLIRVFEQIGAHCFILWYRLCYLRSECRWTPKVVTVDYLGDFTNELEEFSSGSFIQEFVSGGPKNYAFSVFCPSTGKHIHKCKVKGIILNNKN